MLPLTQLALILLLGVAPDPGARAFDTVVAAARAQDPAAFEAALNEAASAFTENTEQASRRRTAFATYHTLDRQYAWSLTPAWTSLSGWERGLTGWHAKNVAPRRSPGWLADDPSGELAYFGAFAAVPGDRRERENLACRYLAHFRTIARLTRNVVMAVPAHCDRFDRWARWHEFESFEVVLVAPSGVNPGSLFGHTLLRLRYRGEPVLESRTVGYLAEVEMPFREDAVYPIKGIFGLYHAHLLERPFVSLYHDYVAREARNLRRWELKLSPSEKRALLERIWTLKQVAAFKYYFFSDNCASMTIDLINGVLPADRQVVYPRLIAAGPTGTVEGLAYTRAWDGRRLLEASAEIPSFRDAALAAEAARSTLPAPFHAASDDERLAAYQTDATGPGLAVSLPLEIYVNTVRNLQIESEQEKNRIAALRRQASKTAAALDSRCHTALTKVHDDAREIRLAGYRALAEAPCASAGDASPGVAYGRLVAALYEDPEWASPCDGACLQSAGIDASLVEPLRLTRVSAPLKWLAANAGPAQAAVDRSPAKNGHTGIDTMWIGLEGDSLGAASLVWGGAVLDERIGDQRAFGFPGGSGMTVLRSLLAWSAAKGRIEEAESRIFGFRTMRPKFDELESGPVLGWEVYADVTRSAARRVAAATDAGVGILIPLTSERDFGEHVMGVLGARYVGAYPDASVSSIQAVGSYMRLETRRFIHTAGNGDNHWRAALVVEPYWDTLAAAFGTVLRAEGELRIQIGDDDVFLRRRHVGAQAFFRLSAARGELGFSAPSHATASLGLVLE